MTAPTLEDYLAAYRAGDAAMAAAARTLTVLARAAVTVRETIMLGALGTAFDGVRGTRNADGDAQKDLDVLADEIFLEAVSSAPVALYASEEREHPVVLDREGLVALAIDPLDGSSNIDTNLSIGTIFSLLPVGADPDADALRPFLQPGNTQLGAGFFIYGPQLALVLTLGAGTHVFVYSPRLGSFVHVYANVVIAARTNEFAINMANYRFWDDAIRHYVDDCLKGQEGPHGHDCNMRWLGSLVADAYRILVRGGVFAYPGDARKGYGKGRLRLVYEANPIAFIVEQANGLATDTVDPILELVPASLHERVPLAFGSRNEVQQITRYHADLDQVGLRSPLFGNRGLFRT